MSRQRATLIRLHAIRDCLSQSLQMLRAEQYQNAQAYVTDALERVDRLLPTAEDMADKRRKARLAGKLGGTTAAKNRFRGLANP